MWFIGLLLQKVELYQNRFRHLIVKRNESKKIGSAQPLTAADIVKTQI